LGPYALDVLPGQAASHAEDCAFADAKSTRDGSLRFATSEGGADLVDDEFGRQFRHAVTLSARDTLWSSDGGVSILLYHVNAVFFSGALEQMVRSHATGWTAVAFM
jgi:hypothetical protein